MWGWQPSYGFLYFRNFQNRSSLQTVLTALSEYFSAHWGTLVYSDCSNKDCKEVSCLTCILRNMMTFIRHFLFVSVPTFQLTLHFFDSAVYGWLGAQVNTNQCYHYRYRLFMYYKLHMCVTRQGTFLHHQNITLNWHSYFFEGKSNC